MGQEEWSRGGICSLKGEERPPSGISGGVAPCTQAVPGHLNPRSRKPGTTGLSSPFLRDQPSSGCGSEAKEENM